MLMLGGGDGMSEVYMLKRVGEESGESEESGELHHQSHHPRLTVPVSLTCRQHHDEFHRVRSLCSHVHILATVFSNMHLEFLFSCLEVPCV